MTLFTLRSYLLRSYLLWPGLHYGSTLPANLPCIIPAHPPSLWQEHALDALLVWLQHEPAHVTRFMEAPFGLEQLQVWGRVRG